MEQTVNPERHPTVCSHPVPPNPGSHAHWPLKQKPLPEHPRGQPLLVAVSASGGTSAEEENGVSDSAEPREGASGAEQSGPDHPASHTHSSPRQTPLPEHAFGQASLGVQLGPS